MSLQNLLSSYSCHDVPPKLYRVQHPESQAQFDRQGDLVAKSTECPQSAADFADRLRCHFHWGYRQQDSMFMSLFDSRDEAIKWGRARYAWNRRQSGSDEDVKIYEVSTARLSGAYLYKADDLCSRCDIPLKRDVTHEYLIGHCIPASAIHLAVDIEALIWDEEEAKAEEEARRRRANDPRYHYVSELGDYYDTDEEAEEHNINDDLMKMVEGDWN